MTSYPTNIQDAQLTFALPFYPFLAPCLTAVRKIAVIELDELTFGVQNANHVTDTKDLRSDEKTDQCSSQPAFGGSLEARRPGHLKFFLGFFFGGFSALPASSEGLFSGIRLKTQKMREDNLFFLRN